MTSRVPPASGSILTALIGPVRDSCAQDGTANKKNKVQVAPIARIEIPLGYRLLDLPDDLTAF